MSDEQTRKRRAHSAPGRWAQPVEGKGREPLPVLFGSGVCDQPGTGTDFQAVAAVRGLQEEHFVAHQAQNALHRGGDILMKTVRELDDYHRAAARRANEAAGDDPASFAPKLAQYDVHEERK